MYYVYVLLSKTSGKIYIGQTNNLSKRLNQHNNKDFDNRAYTKLMGANWKIIYKEEFNCRNEAMVREKNLKSHKGRDWIKKTILGR